MQRSIAVGYLPIFIASWHLLSIYMMEDREGILLLFRTCNCIFGSKTIQTVVMWRPNATLRGFEFKTSRHPRIKVYKNLNMQDNNTAIINTKLILRFHLYCYKKQVGLVTPVIRHSERKAMVISKSYKI